MTDPTNPAHTEYLPYRNYFSTDVQIPTAGEKYAVDVEIWPTNVVVGIGHRLSLEIASHDTQGSGLFEHTHSDDRPDAVFKGINCIHVGPDPSGRSYLTLPIIPDDNNA